MPTHDEHPVHTKRRGLPIAAVVIHAVQDLAEHAHRVAALVLEPVHERVRPEGGVACLARVHPHAHAAFGDAAAARREGARFVVVVEAAGEQRRAAGAADRRVDEEVGQIDVTDVRSRVRHCFHGAKDQVLVIGEEHYSRLVCFALHTPQP
eukprot:gene9888-biopygen2107